VSDPQFNREDLFTIEIKELEPTGQIEPQAWMTASGVQAIFTVLEDAGYEVRFVGGCVRNGIAKRPVADVDLATTAKPDTVMELLEAAGIKAIPTGLDHGTITAVSEGANYEITTLREDVATDGRHAEVMFTDDWIADAKRRDFTINTMSATRTGEVYDPFDGIPDMAYGRINFVGNPAKRISEDYLRILRYFRFYTSHGRPPVSREALAACRMAASNLQNLSGERVRDELLKILLTLNSPDTLIMMKGEHVLEQVLDEATEFGDLRALIWLCTTAMNLDKITMDPVRNLAILLPSDSKPEVAENIASRWRLSNAERNRLSSLCEFPQPDPMSPKPDHLHRLHRVGAELYADQCLITWARESASIAKIPKDRRQGWMELMEMITTWQEPAFPITGRDLQDKGIKQGPELGVLLNQIRDWWIDNDCTADRDACLNKLKQLTP